jgi:hypothetical protein
MKIDRRNILRTLASASVLPTAALAAPEPEKTAFMKAAIADLEARREEKKSTNRAEYTGWKSICVPVPFADFDYYWTEGLLIWSGKGPDLDLIAVPNGFCTDLTSVPQLFWSYIPKTGRYAWAAIVHDYLYWTQTTTREAADKVLEQAMEDSQVSKDKLVVISTMVSQLGGSSWDANAKAKAAGDKRFLKVFPPKTELISWDQWRVDKTHFAD